MKKGKIIVVSIFAVFLMLMIPNVNAFVANRENTIIQYEDYLKKELLMFDTFDIPPWLEKLLEFLLKFDPIDLYFSRAVFVDDDAPDEWYDYMHVKTIQEGIDHARFAYANTIRVYDGTYEEQITMKSSISFPTFYARFGFWLIGNGSDSTIIDAKGSDYGVDLKFTSGWSRIIGFTITNASDSAINIGESQWNFIYENRLINNEIGIKNEGGKYSPIWKNNFINNEINAYDTGENDWSYDEWKDIPMTGNYWNDYTGEDMNDDGLGDTPYQVVGGNSIDSYPLMQPWEE